MENRLIRIKTKKKINRRMLNLSSARNQQVLPILSMFLRRRKKKRKREIVKKRRRSRGSQSRMWRRINLVMSKSQN